MDRLIAQSNDLAGLERLLDEAEAFVEKSGVPPAMSLKLRLLVEELAGNAVRYGYRDGRSGQVAVTLDWDGEAIACTIEDDGDPFDPLTDVPAADLGRSIDERRVGGLGVHLARTMVQDLTYRRIANRNRLSFCLLFSAGPEVG